MKNVPEILILGRPNVGKSTLINRLIKGKKAITFDTPGVTRDLSSYPCHWEGKNMMIIDSGGVLFQKASDINFQPDIEELVQGAIEKADKVLFVTDINDDVHPMDTNIAKRLRPVKEKVVVVVNKLDNPERYSESQAFSKLGLGDPIPISAVQGQGINEMMYALTKDFKKGRNAKEKYDDAYKIALVGRPNVGKSSLVNAIMNETRVLVNEQAGTTRDAIELYFNQGDEQYVFIDTAGLRKKSKVTESIEFYSTVRTRKAITEAHLVVVLLDAVDFLNEQDKKIINEVIAAKKNMMIFVNKWDQTVRTDTARRDLETIMYDELPFLVNYPLVFGSALDKQNIGKIFHLIPSIIATAETRIPTAKLNQIVKRIFEKNPPPSKKGKRLTIYYATQAEKSPPAFILFVNDPKLLDKDYIRFFEKRFRELIDPFFGVPIQIFIKGKPGRK